ncbi:TPA: hypothetical protein ACPJZ5_003804 [Vibrio diabolicus]
MNKEIDDFRNWVNFQNKKMAKWVTEYFIKKGIPRRLPSVDNIITNPLEQSILEQADHYFSRIEDKALRQEKLSKMKKSWAQYCRRTKGAKRVHTVYVDDKTHTVLKTIKKKEQLDNLGQSVESIIDGTALKREIRRLERDNDLLNKKLESYNLLKTKSRQQEVQLEEMRNKIDSLEKRNITLTTTIEQLASSLSSK